MTERFDPGTTPEARITAWLDDAAPAEIPERVLTAAFERSWRVDQIRPTGFQRWRWLPLDDRMLLLRVAAVAALVVGFTALLRPSVFRSTAGAPSSAPTLAVSSPSPAEAGQASGSVPPGPSAGTPARTVFESNRYGYTIALNSDWTMTENPGSWDGTTDPTRSMVDTIDAGTDRFNNSNLGQWIEIGVQPISTGVSLGDWVSTEAHKATLPGCTYEPPGRARKIGDSEVVVVRGTCATLTTLDVLFVVGGRGVLVQWATWTTTEAQAEPGFLDLLATLHFSTR